ncbi:MAG: KpsF/GutQ family sugar-phosphate isomerase [Myxococcota bacterium]
MARRPLKKADPLEKSRRFLKQQSAALDRAAGRLDHGFEAATQLVVGLPGRLVVTGMGKAGFVAQKISATFASTGTPSLFLHPADAVHGDLGRISAGDVVLALSYSGETEEIVRLMKLVRRAEVKIIAITSEASTSLGVLADVVIPIGRYEEAGNGLAPTTSTTVMLAVGDALAMAVQEAHGFSAEKFYLFHPAGALGKKLRAVREVMRTGEMLPLIPQGATIHQALVAMTETKGRPGAALIVDRRQKLLGVFTDGDLRRLLELGTVDVERPVRTVMTKAPKTVSPEEGVVAAAKLLRAHRIDQVPVVDRDGKAVGLLDVQDLL